MNQEANLLWQQAVTMYREKKYSDALSILENLEKLSPQDKNILFQKALCLAALRRFDETQALCLKLKGQFTDARVEELEQWINRNAQPYHTRRFEELKAETLPSQAQAQTASTGPATPIQPIGESLKAAELGKMFCPQCGFNNPDRTADIPFPDRTGIPASPSVPDRRSCPPWTWKSMLPPRA